MNMDSHKDPNSEGLQSATEGQALLKCEDIQDLLLAYMSRELGESQSMFIREHIRKCDDCKAEAAEIEAMFALLRSDSAASAGKDARLTDDRRKRIIRAVFHPVIDWIDIHHRLVSIVLAVVVLVVVFLAVRDAAIFKREPLEEGIPIWRMFKSGDLPELVEKARNEGEIGNGQPDGEGQE